MSEEESLAVQWLGLCTFTAEGKGSIPGAGTKILQAAWCGKKTNKQTKKHVSEAVAGNVAFCTEQMSPDKPQVYEAR